MGISGLHLSVRAMLRRIHYWIHAALCIAAFALPGYAQNIHFGLKAGVPMTEYYETGSLISPVTDGRGLIQYSAATRRWTAGPTFEWRIRHGLGVEVDLLYKRTGYVHDEQFSSPLETGTVVYDVKKGSSWDFPMMLKYRFARAQRFFVTGGYVLRHIGPVRAQGSMTNTMLLDSQPITTTTAIDTTEPSELQGDRNFSGVTVGGGIEFRRGRLGLLPEFRYTGWVTNIATAGNALRLNPNQAEFLLGFLF